MDITLNEVLAELAKVAKDSDTQDGALTSTEIMDATGWGVARTLTAVRKAIKAGRMVAVRTRRPRIDGQMNTVTAYRIVKAKGVKR